MVQIILQNNPADPQVGLRMKKHFPYLWQLMDKLCICVPKVTNRLRYVLDLVLREQLGLDFIITTNLSEFESFEGPCLIYGDKADGKHLFFKANHLLFEREISSQELKAFDRKGVKAIFPVFDKNAALDFDVFAAVFYLVSRYEEYLPYVRDQHGRFEAGSSVLHKLKMLQTPLVNLWCIELGKLLMAKFPGLTIKNKKYQFIPTYDVDAAWAYLHKGLFRTSGAYLRDLYKFDMDEVKLRTKVLRGRCKDPFDTFGLQLAMQKEFRLRPVYFILFASYGLNDKNIPTRNRYFRNLIKQLGDYADIGIHPSYASFSDKKILQQEVESLSKVLNRQITQSRQHFLRMSLPSTYLNLINRDIEHDYTMGYAQQPGFRAGIADSFRFYDLDHDVPTSLRIHPFTIMDGTLCDYLQLSPQEAVDQIKSLIRTVKNVNGTFISLWHNESLSDQKRWSGWVQVYKELVTEAVA